MIRPSLLQKPKNDAILELVYQTNWQEIINNLVACYCPNDRDNITKIMEILND